eukprot:217506_1
MSSDSQNSFRNIMIGSFCVALGNVFYAANDVLIKISHLRLSQLILGKLTSQFVIAALWWTFKRPQNYENKHWYGQTRTIWMRGFACAMTTIGFYYGIIRLPIGDAQSIFYQSPIITVLMARMFLKEELPQLAPLMCLFGIVGIVLISQPSFLIAAFNLERNKNIETLNVDGVIAMLIATVSWSTAVILVRTALEENFLQLEIVSSQQTIVLMILILIVNNFIVHNEFIGELDVDDWSLDYMSIALVTIIGIFGFCSLALNVVGYQYAVATKVSWLEYTIIILGFLSQALIFNDKPNQFETIGCFLVIAACLLSLFEEFYKKYKGMVRYDVLYNQTTDTENETDLSIEY